MLRKMIFILCLLLACGWACAENETDSMGGYTVVRKGTGVIEEGFSGEDVEIMVYGLEDASGNLAIPYEYDNLSLQAGGTIVIAEKNELYGLLDVSGNVLLPIEYDTISDFTLNRAYVRAKHENGGFIYGMIDEKGKFILPMEYTEIAIGDDGIVLAAKPTILDSFILDPMYGYMNLDGEWIIDPQYNAARPFEGDYAVVGKHVSIGNVNSATGLALRYGIINRDGETILPCEYEGVTLWEDGLGVVSQGYPGMNFRIDGDKVSFFYTHEDGREEILPDWAAEWAAVVPLEAQPKSYLGCWPNSQSENKWAMLDANGNVTHSSALASIESFSEGIALISRDGRWGYMRNDGVLIAEPQFLRADPFIESCALVQVGDGYNFIDTSGKMISEVPFNYAYSFENGYATVSLGGNDGLINTQGEFVLPMEYDYIGNVGEDGTVSAEKGGEEYLFRLTENGAEEVKEVASDLVLEDYMPFTGSKVAKLSGEPTLEKRASSDHGHPRLDGATALFPVYSAIVEAVYPDETRYERDYDSKTLVTCTKTNKAYDRLIAGEVDIIFCAGPSDAQIAVADAAGVEFELTPFGRESFVFIVNKDNPLENITVEQIQKIYSGEITSWDELGVDGLGEIIAYQRPDDSGSQTALQRLMGDIPIMDAPEERISSGMGDILETIEYRNLPNAIGYTFRFFCTEMIGSDVKLLSIDGVEPNTETIVNNTYPITSTLYMVTRKGEDNPNVQALMDWVQSKQGQQLVEKSGYVAYTG